MVVPQPIHPLTNHCSVVVDQTLYVYSPAGFQSLQLEEGAEWKELPMGISVTGGECVEAIPGGDLEQAALYIVGGSVNETASSWNYPGIQRYSFAQKSWEWVKPVDLVTQNRRNHAATYLNASQSILVYSGSQNGDSGPSSSTFVISTNPPFSVSSYDSAAPPAIKPMLKPWSENSAVMFGGGDQNEAVFTFSKEEGWKNLGVTLTSPITNADAVQCTVVFGDDGSKVLERFDMSSNPNKISRTVLLTTGGVVAAPGVTVGDKRKRVTIDDWPAYNGTLAPKITRSGYSVAQDANGVAIINGGNDEDPLCMFDQKANSWLNATEFFSGAQFSIQSTTASTSLTPSPTSTSPSAASSTETDTPAAAPVDNKSRMLTVLGATLGAIFGIAAILILILLCLRYKRGKKKKDLQSGYIEKDRLSFADRGAAFMSEAGGSVGHQFSQSQTSLAIMSGHTGSSHKRGLGPLGSDASTQGLVTKKSPLGYADPVEMSKLDMKVLASPETVERDFEKSAPPPSARPAANIGRSRSSGWSRYFANNEATNLATMPSGRSTYASERTSTGSQSLYTDVNVYSQPSQTIPPLDINFKFEGQRLSQVAKGSPTLGNSTENLRAHQPMQAELARANSNGSSRSGVSQDGQYVSDAVESWTPVGGNNSYGRPPSSSYTNSVVVPDGQPLSTNPYFYPGRLGGEERESTVTVFPRGVPENPNNPSTQKPGQPDMSWLNLGGGTH